MIYGNLIGLNKSLLSFDIWYSKAHDSMMRSSEGFLRIILSHFLTCFDMNNVWPYWCYSLWSFLCAIICSYLLAFDWLGVVISMPMDRTILIDNPLRHLLSFILTLNPSLSIICWSNQYISFYLWYSKSLCSPPYQDAHINTPKSTTHSISLMTTQDQPTPLPIY